MRACQRPSFAYLFGSIGLFAFDDDRRLCEDTHTHAYNGRAHAPYPEQNVCVFTLDKAHFVYTKCWAIAINPRLLLEDVADGSGASNAEGRKSHVLTFFSSCTQFVRKFYFGV